MCTLISSVMLLEKYYYPWFRDVKSGFTLFPLIIQESVHRTEGTSSRGLIVLGKHPSTESQQYFEFSYCLGLSQKVYPVRRASIFLDKLGVI